MFDIYGVKIDEYIDKYIFDKLVLMLSKQKQNRIRKFIQYEDALRALVSDLLIRSIIIEKLNIKNNDIIFQFNKYGKPFLKNYDFFKFNISHSGKWVTCAISQSSIGIDIEQIKPIDFEIAKKFFSHTEYIDISEKTEQEKSNYFYALWTLKESYVKAVGKGLAIPLNSFTIKIGNKITIQSRDNTRKYNFAFLDIDNKYKMAVCSEKELIPINLKLSKILSVNQLIKNFIQ